MGPDATASVTYDDINRPPAKQRIKKWLAIRISKTMQVLLASGVCATGTMGRASTQMALWNGHCQNSEGLGVGAVSTVGGVCTQGNQL